MLWSHFKFWLRRLVLIILKCQMEDEVHFAMMKQNILDWTEIRSLSLYLKYSVLFWKQSSPLNQYCQPGDQHFYFRCPPPVSPPGRKSLTSGWNFPSSFLSQNLHNLALKLMRMEKKVYNKTAKLKIKCIARDILLQGKPWHLFWLEFPGSDWRRSCGSESSARRATRPGTTGSSRGSRAVRWSSAGISWCSPGSGCSLK